jgi:hypothetical protein
MLPKSLGYATFSGLQPQVHSYPALTGTMASLAPPCTLLGCPRLIQFEPHPDNRLSLLPDHRPIHDTGYKLALFPN